jgi:hypothetical protein
MQVKNETELARTALSLMQEALRLLDLADEGLSACHLAEAIDALERGASRYAQAVS